MVLRKSQYISKPRLSRQRQLQDDEFRKRLKLFGRWHESLSGAPSHHLIVLVSAILSQKDLEPDERSLASSAQLA